MRKYNNNVVYHANSHALFLTLDANTYFCDGLAAVKTAGLSKEVVSIAPWFGDEQATGSEWTDGGNSSWISAYWNTVRWVDGGNASPSPSKYTTSFGALDVIIEALLTAQTSGRFPNLERITVNGFSAGAQLASRWALFSDYGNGRADTNIPIRTVIADGSTYLHLADLRPSTVCSPGTDTGKTHTCDAFEVPEDYSISCPDYDAYKYGLNTTGVLYNRYLDAFIDDPTKLVTAIEAYLGNSEIRFIFGEYDVCNCNTQGYNNTQKASICYPTGTSCTPNDYGGTLNGINCCDTYPDTQSSNVLSVTCEALYMGQNRLQRGLNYMSYLMSKNQAQHAKKGLKRQSETTWPLFGFFQGGHSNHDFYASDLFQEWVFGTD